MKIQFDFIADVLISATGESDVNAVYCDENVWLTQKMMGLLYNVETHTINYHLIKYLPTERSTASISISPIPGRRTASASAV